MACHFYLCWRIGDAMEKGMRAIVITFAGQEIGKVNKWQASKALQGTGKIYLMSYLSKTMNALNILVWRFSPFFFYDHYIIGMSEPVLHRFFNRKFFPLCSFDLCLLWSLWYCCLCCILRITMISFINVVSNLWVLFQFIIYTILTSG